MNSYEVDISIDENVNISMRYDNIIQYDKANIIQEYISSKRYYNTKIEPNGSCYITIGGDLRS